jgi:hypothetical protein
MVRNVVLKHLYSGDPRGTFIGNLGFATDTHDRGVVVQAVDEGGQRVWSDARVGIDLKAHQLLEGGARGKLTIKTASKKSA